MSLKKTKKRDCEIIVDNIGDVFSNVGECFETVFDEKKKTSGIVGNIFGLGASLTKLGWNVGSCVVKNTPKAVVAVASAKRELVEVIEDGYKEHQKQVMKDALDQKIKRLK